MPAKWVSVSDTEVKIEVTVSLNRSMLKTEEAIQASLNEVGCLASAEALKYLDTDGSPIVVGGERWPTKGQPPKEYQTPYGPVMIERHVYQRSGGGEDVLSLGTGGADHCDLHAAFCQAGQLKAGLWGGA